MPPPGVDVVQSSGVRGRALAGRDLSDASSALHLVEYLDERHAATNSTPSLDDADWLVDVVLGVLADAGHDAEFLAVADALRPRRERERARCITHLARSSDEPLLDARISAAALLVLDIGFRLNSPVRT